MAIKIINIDDRLIHGQVATTWIKDFGVESVIIVDNKTANDPIQKKIAGLAVPGVQVVIFSVEKFLKVIKKTTIKKPTMLLFANPVELLEVKKGGLDFDYVNISGMRFNPNRKRLLKNVSVTDEELVALKELINEQGVNVYTQTTTRDEKINVKDLIKDK
ncbi:PTS sugar transporter subunit IIB [Helcococcus kunzii]|uniref:PTS system mannose/fructose/N-acetylgalactosamine-transporter subunit IIB n=1 Tax=Helcococcus kunzii TaxID=40091 RepID=UPI001C987516|nr:PTS sugar transporter subunit IIB [Helcococcus kunzii]QZO76051.1 PTS sugar transporter subunit IIB [Helcococcus kunzii]